MQENRKLKDLIERKDLIESVEHYQTMLFTLYRPTCNLQFVYIRQTKPNRNWIFGTDCTHNALNFLYVFFTKYIMCKCKKNRS